MMSSDASPSSPGRLLALDVSFDYDLKMTLVNERVVIRDDALAGWRVVLVSGVVFAQFRNDDTVSQRHVCVQLRVSGLATQKEIVAAFGHSRATQCRWEQRYWQGGLEGLFPEPLLGRRSTMPASLEDKVVELHSKGLGMRRIAAGLGLTVHQVAGVYTRRELGPRGA